MLLLFLMHDAQPLKYIFDTKKWPSLVLRVQVALEGQISRASLEASLSRGHRASGDLIPWSLSQQYQDGQFAGLSGARIVRIATHTDVQKVNTFLFFAHLSGALDLPGAPRLC